MARDEVRRTSLKGRTTRGQLWVTSTWLQVFPLLGMAIDLLIWGTMIFTVILWVISMLLQLVLLWRRLQDLGVSGLFILAWLGILLLGIVLKTSAIILIPLVIGVIAQIFLYCVRWTRWTNAFWDDIVETLPEWSGAYVISIILFILAALALSLLISWLWWWLSESLPEIMW